MNVHLIREYQRRFPTKPTEEKPTTAPSFRGNCDGSRVSDYCQIGPKNRHNLCVTLWCKCPCHIAQDIAKLYEHYDR